jgi:hypothetical protein
MVNTADHSRTELMTVLRALHAAMVEARIDALDGLLDKDYSLEHITGYVQPRDEWLDAIRSGEFMYHHIELDDRTLALKITGQTATISGRGVFDATINGMHAPWRLRFALACSRQGGQWRLLSAHYRSDAS